MPLTSFKTDKTLVDSKLFARACEEFLFADVCTDETNLKVGPKEEIHPELPRDDPDQGDSTRLVIVDRDTKKTVTAYDPDRLSSHLDVDRILKEFEGHDVGPEGPIFGIFVTVIFELYEYIRHVIDNDPTEDTYTLSDLRTDLLAALIAIGFNDPLDIFIHIWKEGEVKYCWVAAVKPRLKN